MPNKPLIWPAWVLIMAAISLEIVPLPGFMQPFRLPWAAIAMIYWTMMWPQRFGETWSSISMPPTPIASYC